MQTIKQAVHSVQGKIAETKYKEPTEADLKPGERLSKGYTCFALGAPLKLSKFVLPVLKDDEVEVKTITCSVCHTDLSMIRNEIGITSYPFVPGHEAIGIITKIGKNVPESSNLKIGQRVGIGFFKRSCHSCEFCSRGAENLCPSGEPIMALKGNRGGFSEFIQADWKWAIPIPDSLPSEFASPLMCAGITVYSPLKSWNAQPNWKVGIIGLGGLGHLFVKMAKQIFGCEVYVFSHTEEKEIDAKVIGADHHISHNDDAAMLACTEKLDFILNTVYYNLNWKKFFEALKPDGIFCCVGFPPSALTVPIFDLVYKQRKVVGSNVGPPNLIKEMLEQCAKYKIYPEIERHTVHDCEKILDRFETEGIYYRAVMQVEGEYDKVETEIKSG